MAHDVAARASTLIDIPQQVAREEVSNGNAGISSSGSIQSPLVELDIWGEPKPKLGDKVRLRGGTEEAVIDRLGMNPGVYHVTPAIGGSHWHIDKTIEAIHG